MTSPDALPSDPSVPPILRHEDRLTEQARRIDDFMSGHVLDDEEDMEDFHP